MRSCSRTAEFVYSQFRNLISSTCLKPTRSRPAPMRTGLLSSRLIGLLLAITTLYPSWISGPCCCTQTSFAKLSPAACCSRMATGMAAAAIKPKKGCCAARAVVANAEPIRPNAVRPVSNCCCRQHLKSSAVTRLVRSVELTTPPGDFPIADVRQAVPSVNPQSDPKWNVTGDPDEPPDPSERCALLRRWLA